MPVSEPSKYTTLWSQSGIRFDIPPTADPATGKAGFDVGFSSINMASEAAGGIPPWGQDFNGIFYSITKAIQYTQAGGVPTFDAELAASIGGYAVNAMVKAESGLAFFINKVSGNSSNPNTGGGGWVRFGPDNYGSPMIGVPIPWPIEQLPQEIWPDCGMVFLKTGDSFDTSQYPKLAALYPSGVVKSVRGKFIRGLDDGAGVDPGRSILTDQLDSIQGHGHATALSGYSNTDGVNKGFIRSGNSTDFTSYVTAVNGPTETVFGAPRVSDETRPENVAYLYIVRAS